MTSVPDPPAPPPRRGLPRVVRVGISVALIVWLLTRLPLAEAADTARALHPAPLLLAAVAIVLGQFLRAARTCALLRGGVRAADLPPMLRMQMLAFLPGMISPAKAGELLKVELLRREWDISIARGTGAFLAERLADVGVLGVFAVWGVTAVFGRTIPGTVTGAAVAGIAGCAVAAWVWRTGRIPAAFRERLRNALADVRWAPVAVTSLAYWTLVVGIVWLFARSAGSGAPFRALLGAVPLSLITALLPISLGGFGVREGAMLLLFQQDAVGCTEAQAVAISLLYAVIGLGVPALMGLGYMLAGPRHA